MKNSPQSNNSNSPKSLVKKIAQQILRFVKKMPEHIILYFLLHKPIEYFNQLIFT